MTWQSRMSEEQLYDFHIPSLSLSFILLAAILGSIAVSFVLLLIQLAHEAVVQDREARVATARRLRYQRDGTEVILKPAVGLAARSTTTHVLSAVGRSFHLFLSHVWGTGQDQMRIVKQRLREMLPDAEIFLDVDDLTKGRGAEYVDASSLVLVFCSRGAPRPPAPT
jgi:hypothetical protein